MTQPIDTRDFGPYLGRGQMRASDGKWRARRDGTQWLVGLVVDLTGPDHVTNLRFVHQGPTGEITAAWIYLGCADNYARAPAEALAPPLRATILAHARQLKDAQHLPA